MSQTRRQFLATSAMIAGTASFLPQLIGNARPRSTSESAEPWYRRVLRWGQTNITEADPANYDIAWWRDYWKRTRVQGVIINAGGIVAYYEGKEPLQYRPPALGTRDLFGELAQAAHADGLAVLARMDSNRTHEEFYTAHPDWFAVDTSGKPYKAGDLFITCINSPYYKEYLPNILREIAQRYLPEGFTDNSWSGLSRENICHCEHCRKSFLERSGQPLPTQKNWQDPVYRDWIMWSYARRVDLWELNNRVTREAGGPNCLWVGMNSGSISSQCQSFRDYREICARSEIVMLDHQARGEGGFHQNAETGALIHGLIGWNRLIPESMAMYQAGKPTFRKTSRPVAESRLWMLEGIAGGIQPWWHHVGASQEDLRQFDIAGPINRWHEAHQEFLINRTPIASVGLVWSQRNMDFFGRDHANELIELPWRGWSHALVRARIPYLPVHIDELERQSANLSALVLPNLAALSEAQAASVRRFVERGGGLVATGRTSLYDEWGQPRRDFALAELFGAQLVSQASGNSQSSLYEPDRRHSSETLHSYLRVKSGLETNTIRRDILSGFEGTEVLPFGGWLGDVVAAQDAEVLLTYVPPFPIYPPETSWMREPRTSIAGLIMNTKTSRGRVAFLPADVDRRFGSDHLPDQGRLLSNLARWAVGGQLPLRITGPGFIDCRYYRQSNRCILHLVNLTAGEASAPVDELIAVGPLKIEIKVPEYVRERTARLLVAGTKIKGSLHAGTLTLTLQSLFDHEVIVIG